MLRNYYDNKVSCENLSNAIYACALRSVAAGTRPARCLETVTEEEHQDLVKLERNI